MTAKAMAASGIGEKQLLAAAIKLESVAWRNRK